MIFNRAFTPLMALGTVLLCVSCSNNQPLLQQEQGRVPVVSTDDGRHYLARCLKGLKPNEISRCQIDLEEDEASSNHAVRGVGNSGFSLNDFFIFYLFQFSQKDVCGMIFGVSSCYQNYFGMPHYDTWDNSCDANWLFLDYYSGSNNRCGTTGPSYFYCRFTPSNTSLALNQAQTFRLVASGNSGQISIQNSRMKWTQGYNSNGLRFAPDTNMITRTSDSSTSPNPNTLLFQRSYDIRRTEASSQETIAAQEDPGSVREYVTISDGAGRQTSCSYQVRLMTLLW